MSNGRERPRLQPGFSQDRADRPSRRPCPGIETGTESNAALAIGFAFHDIAERSFGAGMTDVKLDLRLRYEIKRGFALYFGIRSRFLVGQTEDIAEARGEDSDKFFFMADPRFAF